MVAVRARRHEADHALADPHAIVLHSVGVSSSHLQEHESLLRTFRTLPQRALTADEVTLVEGDEPVESGHPRRVVLPELRRPDPVPLLETEAVHGPVADQPQAVFSARLSKLVQQRPVPIGRDHDLVAELTGQRDAVDHRLRGPDVHLSDREEREGTVRHVIVRQLAEDRP